MSYSNAKNLLFFPDFSGFSGTFQQLSDYLNNYCNNLNDFSVFADNYGRAVVSPVMGMQVSPAIDIWCNSPNGRLHLVIIREEGDFTVNNPGVSGVAETVSSDLAPGSLNSKVPGLLETKILQISHLYGNPLERVFTLEGELKYLNLIYPASAKVSYDVLISLVSSGQTKAVLFTEDEIRQKAEKFGTTSKMQCFMQNWETHPFYDK